MDGRVQLPVIEYLKQEFNVDYVDSITEPGPVRILAEERNSALAKSILDRIEISVNKHKSVGVAVVAHYDCAGNPADETTQKKQLVSAVELLKDNYASMPIVGLWLDSNWTVYKNYPND